MPGGWIISRRGGGIGRFDFIFGGECIALGRLGSTILLFLAGADSRIARRCTGNRQSEQDQNEQPRQTRRNG